MDMLVSRKTITLGLSVSLALIGALVLPFHASFGLAQKQVSSADGQIVTASSAAQAQEEEPELRTTTPSAGAAWNDVDDRGPQTHSDADPGVGGAGHDGHRPARCRTDPGEHEQYRA